MKFLSLHRVFSAFLLTGITKSVFGQSDFVNVGRRAKVSILNDPAPQPDLPAPDAAASVAAQNSLTLDDIQGDIFVGMKKKAELFIFFHINNNTTFKSKLKDIKPFITSTTQLIDVAKQPQTAVNIAFSQSGLTALGITDNLGDSLFAGGQFADATNLGDPGTVNWVHGLKGTSVHGLFILASDSAANINVQKGKLTSILGKSITIQHSLAGNARPGSQEGHEHFGFMDGISQPAIKGFTTNPLPGQSVLDPGTFLLGEAGDSVTRPAWTKGGSFLAFRQLKQLVPEFNKYLNDNAIVNPSLTHEEGAALLGARMVGRWKSGAPIDLTPLKDDPVLAADRNRNNNFDFTHPGFNISSDQTHCPFSAHIRKTRPRADFQPPNTANQIIRSGIPYGPEVTSAENVSGKTSLERGLAFIAYQSNIGQGFNFIQRNWANNPNFFFGRSPGPDPIIGVPPNPPRVVKGLDPFDASHNLTMPDFIVSRGGEYFFSPPISAISDTLAK